MSTTSASVTVLTARLFRGLAEPTRLAILTELLGGERRVRDLVHAVGGSQSNVSGHLACLKECGLVIDRPGDRRQVFYRLAGAEVTELLAAADRLLSINAADIERCDNPMMSGRSDG